MNQIMENLLKVTYPQYTQVGSDHAVIMFVSSVARTNLELDLVARGNSLLMTANGSAATPLPATMRPKSCFLPLFHVLATHTKIRSPKPLVSDWCHVTGLWQDEDDRSLMVRENDVPVLFRDPTTMLLHLTLILPVQVDRVFFVCIVRQIYNLCWMQACLKTACRIPESVRVQLRDEWGLRVRQDESQAYMKVDTVALGLGVVCSLLDSTGIFKDDVDYPRHGTSSNLGPNVTLEELEHCVQAECLNFMRIASILRHYIYGDTLPDIWEADWEFTRLSQFLGMADVDISGRLTSGPCLGWLTSPANLCYYWCREIGSFAVKSYLSARKLILINSSWKQPQLLRLPKNYDAIFQFYYKRVCTNCEKVPKDPSICLLCGVMVCLKEACCKSSVSGDLEAVRHSIECGAGTAPFLAVNSATIVVIRGKRACIWGSIYLDLFGEEDRELKRGKPLFLSLERYHFLESQWLTHRFDHTNRKWIWHRESL